MEEFVGIESEAAAPEGIPIFIFVMDLLTLVAFAVAFYRWKDDIDSHRSAIQILHFCSYLVAPILFLILLGVGSSTVSERSYALGEDQELLCSLSGCEVSCAFPCDCGGGSCTFGGMRAVWGFLLAMRVFAVTGTLFVFVDHVRATT